MNQGSMDPHFGPGPWTTFMARVHGHFVIETNDWHKEIEELGLRMFPFQHVQFSALKFVSQSKQKRCLLSVFDICRLHTYCRLQTADRRLQTADRRPQTTDRRLQTTDCR